MVVLDIHMSRPCLRYHLQLIERNMDDLFILLNLNTYLHTYTYLILEIFYNFFFMITIGNGYYLPEF